MVIGGKELERLIRERQVIDNYVDFDEQLQPNGFDLTVATIEVYKDAGVVDFYNKKRRPSEGEEISISPLGTFLSRGVYRITFNEFIRIPLNMCAITYPRSTLLRSGVFMGTAMGDAGYCGKYQVAIDVSNPHGFIVYPNAKLAQISFLSLGEEQEGYNGIYREGRTV